MNIWVRFCDGKCMRCQSLSHAVTSQGDCNTGDYYHPTLNNNRMQHCRLSDFTIIGKLGKGGFGSAYLARRNSDGLKVCLKVVSLRNGLSTRSDDAFRIQL